MTYLSIFLVDLDVFYRKISMISTAKKKRLFTKNSFTHWFYIIFKILALNASKQEATNCEVNNIQFNYKIDHPVAGLLFYCLS